MSLRTRTLGRGMKGIDRKSHRHRGSLWDGFQSRIAVGAIIVVSAMLMGLGSQGGLLVASLVLFVLFAAVARNSARWALILWLVTLTVFPPWLVMPIGLIHKTLTFPAAASLAVVLGRMDREWPDGNTIDLIVALLAGTLVLGNFVHLVPSFIVNQGLFQWGLCYLAGRKLFTVVRADISPILANFGAVLGTLAVLQTALHFSVAKFPLLGHETSLRAYQTWARIQFRGGVPRAELTFGHSIALGATLALCLPFALRRPLTRRYIFIAVLIGLGSACTLSRSALVADVIVVTFGLVFSSYKPARKVVIGAVLAAAMVPLYRRFVSTINDTAQSASQASSSGAYRAQLFGAFRYLKPLGVAIPGLTIAGSQNVNFHGFKSIDNSVLYVGLYAGGITAALYVLPFLVVVARAIRYGWRPIDIAIIGQIALVLTAAPLTQYQNFLWLMIGLAACRRVGAKDGKARGRMESRNFVVSGFRSLDA